MRTITCTTLFLAAAGLTACDTTDEPVQPGEPARPGEPGQPAVSTSFELTAALSISGEGPYGTKYPDSESFLLHLADAPDGGTVAAIWTASRSTAQSAFDRTDTGLFLRESVPLDLELGPMYGDFLEPMLVVESLRLKLVDRDRDGEAEAVEGSGSGVFEYAYGDVPYSAPFEMTISGDRDVTPPEIYVAGNEAGLAVLDGLRVRASEPLQPGSTARAWIGDTAIDLTPLPGGSYVRSFYSSTVLPFDTEVRIEIDPVPRDLAGLAAESVPTTARTTSGLAVFAEDGFESEPVAMLGSAYPVDGVGTLPAITAVRSLLITPLDTLTMRIPVADGDTHLRFQVRELDRDSYGGGCIYPGIRVGAPGLIGVHEDFTWSASDEPPVYTNDGWWSVAGPIREVSMPLPPGTKGELVFDVYEAEPVYPPCPATALLIDDLRAE